MTGRYPGAAGQAAPGPFYTMFDIRVDFAAIALVVAKFVNSITINGVPIGAIGVGILVLWMFAELIQAAYRIFRPGTHSGEEVQ